VAAWAINGRGGVPFGNDGRDGGGVRQQWRLLVKAAQAGA